MLPAICTEERITLGAEMANGTIIRGQNEISHPAAPGERQLEEPRHAPSYAPGCLCGLGPMCCCLLTL